MTTILRTAVLLAATCLAVAAGSVSAGAAWADPPPSTPVTTTPGPPCSGVGCLQPPVSSTPPPTAPTTPDPGAPASECSIFDNSTWAACVDEILTGFFRTIVVAALNPLLDLLGHTLLSTPDPGSLPRIGELWNSSWQIVLTCYATIVVIAGLLVMGHQTLQTRYTIREVLPRLVVGMVAGAASMAVATQAIAVANALTSAIMGDGLNPDSTAQALKNLYLGGLSTQGIVEQLLAVVFAVGLIGVLITYIVRLATTVVLIAGAPILLMGHALAQTEGIAIWWWRAFGGLLAVQVAQSLTLITALKVLLAPGFTPLGVDASGLVNLLVGLALVYVLVKIPFWILGSVRRHAGSGRSLIGSVARAYVMGKAFGAFAPSRRGHASNPQVSLRRPPRDPAWPAPMRTWWGVDGPRSPAAMAQRIRGWQGIERARRPHRLSPGPTRFLQATAQNPTHDIATTHAPGAPAVTTFRPPIPDPTTAATPTRRPATPPAPIRFGTARPAPVAERWPHTVVSPAPVRFRPATPPAPAPPALPATPPATPVFSEPTVAAPPVQRRARSHTPAPVQFRPAAPTTPPPAPPPVPRPTPARFQAPPPARRRRGGELS